MQNITQQKVAFLDRDGTLIYEPADDFQVDRIDKLFILPGVIDGLQLLQKKGYILVIVSNQDGLGTKKFPRKSFDLPHNKMLRIFKDNGIEFEQVYICPHLPKDRCECRKPKIGLVKEFLETNTIDMKESLVYGNQESDRLFADMLGIRFFSVLTNGQCTLRNNLL